MMLDSLSPLWAIWPDALPALRGRHEFTPVPTAGPSAPVMRLEPGVKGKSVAIVDLVNVMTKSGGWWGATSTVAVRSALRQAAADPNVSGILLQIDSPGGTAAGTADLAADVTAARRAKPVWAQIQDLGASAAYWVASQADMVFANDPTALVGSIGTLLTMYDISSAAKAAGIEALVFATGELKGAGMMPGAPVTEAQRNYFQGIVNAVQTGFDAAVRKGRSLSARELEAVRTGAVFPAQAAMELKLVDGIQSAGKTLGQLAAAK